MKRIVISGATGLLGVPLVHRSLVQLFPSTGTSPSVAVFTVPPEPLHSWVRQSPAVWLPAGRSVPAAVLEVPQVLLLHVKV